MPEKRSRGLIQFVTSLRFLSVTSILFSAALPARAAQAAGIAWHSNLQLAAQQAAVQHKSLLVMVKARWCGPCHKMLQQTFPNPAVAARINSQFIPVLIDADEHAATVKALGIEAMPTVVIISPDHKVTGRFTGFQSAAQLDARLAALAPAPIRPGAPPQFRRWGAPAGGQSYALRPAAPPQQRMSFLQRHAIASRPASPFATSPGPAGPDLTANAILFRDIDTLTGAREFSARGTTPATTIAASPVPDPPD